MCLLAFQWKEHPDYPLILVANREESFKRPASRLHYWKDEPDILAGRDLKGMGTWLGMTVAGKISAVTNEPFTPFEPIEPVISRGNLVREYLSGEEKPVPYGLKLKETRQQFNGYQLLFGDLSQLFVYQNSTGHFKKLAPGSHTLSNAPSQDMLPKNRRANELLTNHICSHAHLKPQELAALFHDTEPAENFSSLTRFLPEEEARKASAIFVEGDHFGTVSTAVILVDTEGKTQFLERKYNQKGMFHDTLLEWNLGETSDKKPDLFN